MTEEKNRKSEVVSIRGLDRDLYSRVVALAKELGKTTGELMNEAMRLYLLLSGHSSTIMKNTSKTISGISGITKAFMEGLKSKEVVTIKGLQEVRLSKEDLEKYGKKVMISTVAKVIFEPDIDAETFDKYIDSIISCTEVQVPDKIPKVLVYSKCKLVSRVVFYA